MNWLVRNQPSILADEKGTAVIETAIVTPVLLLLSLGAFDVSKMVARQNELQNAADVAAGVALASKSDSLQKLDTLKTVLQESAKLTSTKVHTALVYRCGADSNYVASSTTCDGIYATYVKIQLQDTYTPYWTKFGTGSPVDLNVERYAIIGQSTLD